MRPVDFSPTDVHPSLLVNRDDERAELRDDVLRFLDRRDIDLGSTWAVIGDKGIGKTIFTRSVLDDIRAKRSGDAVIVTVDCRKRRSWREVLAQLCWGLVDELREHEEIDPKTVSSELLKEAELLDELAKLDTAEIRVFHERALSFKAHLKLSPANALLSALKADLGLELGLDEKTVRSLSGTRTFDEDRLNRAICALCRDIRRAGLKVVVYLDNVDELDHDYHDEESRIRVRHDAEGLLRLGDAPIALILNMRTYFSRVLPRQMRNPPLRIGPLPGKDLLGLLDARLRHESGAVQEDFGRPETHAAVEQLANLAPTALAFLTWVRYLYQREHLTLDDLDHGFSRYVYAAYATVDENRIRRLMDAFETPTSSIARDRLLEACEGSESILRKLEDMQVVLPEDFWSPESYTLDPIFQTFHLRLVGSAR